MLRIDENTTAYLEETRKFAEQVGLLENLEQNIDYLSNYSCSEEYPNRTACDLYKDFAPHSFYFAMNLWDKETNKYKRWFNGGCIFYNAGESGVSGPQYTVRLDSSKSGWSIHT